MVLENKVPNIPDHELFRPIGRGSYGDVWLARNVLGGWRAVKVVHRASFDRDRPYEREFLGIQRYEPISRSHPGLVQVLHAGRNDPEGYFYYAMELADPLGRGGAGIESIAFDPTTYQPSTLNGFLTEGQRLPIQACLTTGRQLAGGLAHLHHCGLVHRDIKPSNIVFIGGKPKLADLGLVSGISESRSYVGTEGFVPPEGPGTISADLFALGMVLYQASTGLGHDDFPDFPTAWLHGEFPPGAAEFHEIVLRACESDPKRRYQSAVELDRDLALLEQGISLRHLRRIERRITRLRRATVAGAMVASIAIGGLGLASWRARVNRDYYQQSDRLRLRAEAAEKATRDQFYSLLITRALAEMQSGHPGQRTKSLAAIAEAAAIRPGDPALRDLAITALALPDAESVTNIPVSTASDAPPWGSIAIETDCRDFAFADGQGFIHFRSIPSGVEWASVPGTTVGYFSSDGQRLPVLSTNGIWGITDLRSGRTFEVPKYASKGPAPALYADSHSAYLWEGSRPRLYDYESGVQSGEFPSSFPPDRYDYSLDGKVIIASDGKKRQLVAMDEKGAELRVVNWPPQVDLWELSASPDGRWFAAAFADFSVHVWRTEGGGEWVINIHRAEVPAFGWDIPHQRLITSSWDGTTRWWNLASRQAELFENAWGNPLAVSLDGNRVVRFGRFGGDTLGFVVQRIVGGQLLRVLGEPIPSGNADQSKGPWDISFSADGRYCATASFDGIRIWSTDDWKEMAFEPVGRAFSVKWFGETNQFTISGSIGIQVWRIELEADGLAPRLVSSLSQNTGVQRIAGSRDQDRFAILPGEICAFNYTDSRSVAHQAVDFLCLSRDGRYLATMRRNGEEVILMDAKSGRVLKKIPAALPEGGQFGLDSSIIYLSIAGEIQAIHVPDASRLWSLPRPESSGGGAIGICSDGKLIAATLGLRSIALIRCADGQVLATLSAPTPEPVTALDFSPDGRFLAVATTSHLSQIWDLREVRNELKKLNLDWVE